MYEQLRMLTHHAKSQYFHLVFRYIDFLGKFNKFENNHYRLNCAISILKKCN